MYSRPLSSEGSCSHTYCDTGTSILKVISKDIYHSPVAECLEVEQSASVVRSVKTGIQTPDLIYGLRSKRSIKGYDS